MGHRILCNGQKKMDVCLTISYESISTLSFTGCIPKSNAGALYISIRGFGGPVIGVSIE